MTQIEKLPDEDSRKIALTDIDCSFLVEAGAGSGKTSIMAGRVAVLLARGRQRKRIATITFTEFAAAQLRIRIDSFVSDLCQGLVPRDLSSPMTKWLFAQSVSRAMVMARIATLLSISVTIATARATSA